MRRLTESAVAVALAGALSMVTLYRLPQGGAVTPGAMVPLFMIARRYGPGQGAVVGLAYGVLQLVAGGTVVHPLQALCDYGLAFAAFGVAGWRRGPRWSAWLLAMGARAAAHILAAPFFLPGRPLAEAWVFGVGYNLSFLVPEGAVAAGLSWALLRARPGLDENLQPGLDGAKQNVDVLV